MSACPKCGIQTNEEDRFCRRCGAKLTGRQPSATMDALAEEYRKVVADHPNDADAHYSLGLALLYSERWAEAVIHIERVIELAPAFADAYARLVLCRARLGELDEAWAAVERGLIVDPNHEDLRRLRRELLDLRGTDDK